MVPVGAFTDDDDVSAFVHAVIRVWRQEGHGFRILIQVVVQFLEKLEFAARRVQRFENGGRKYVGNLAIEAAEEEDGNDSKANGKRPSAAPKDVSFIAPGPLHHGPGETQGTGNHNQKGYDRHHQMGGRAHGTQEVLDFLQMGGTDGHHGKHIHFPAEENVVADINEGNEHHEEGINAGNHRPQGGETFRLCGEGSIHIGQCHEEGPQHVVVSQMFLFRQGGKTVGPGEGAHPEERQNHRPGKKPRQVFPVQHGKKAEGDNQKDQERRPQPWLHIAVDVGEVPAQMEHCHNDQRRRYHPGKGG